MQKTQRGWKNEKEKKLPTRTAAVLGGLRSHPRGRSLSPGLETLGVCVKVCACARASTADKEYRTSIELWMQLRSTIFYPPGKASKLGLSTPERTLALSAVLSPPRSRKISCHVTSPLLDMTSPTRGGSRPDGGRRAVCPTQLPAKIPTTPASYPLSHTLADLLFLLNLTLCIFYLGNQFPK